MALFVLSDGSAIIATSTGGRLAFSAGRHPASELTSEQVMALAAASTGALVSADPDLTALVQQFSGLEALLPPPAPLGNTARPAALTLGPSDPVPMFRTDLKVTAHPTPGSHLVHDPMTGRGVQLHDFELSLARLLYGTRRCDEVAAAARQLGIPLTMASFGAFLRRLHRLGLLTNPSPMASAALQHPWPARATWDAPTRLLYRNGLGLFRQGRYPEALHLFETMLRFDPDNAEPHEMRRQTLARQAASSEAPISGIRADESTLAAQLQQGGAATLDVGPSGALGELSGQERELAGWLRPPDDGSAHSDRPPPGAWLGLAVLGCGLVIASAGVTFFSLRTPPLAPQGNSPTPQPNAPIVDSGHSARAVETPDAAVEPSPPPRPDAGPLSFTPEPAWGTSNAIARRGRVVMGRVLAPSAGVVAWSAQPDERLRRGAQVGTVSATGGISTAVSVTNDGLFRPLVPTGAHVTPGQQLATIAYHEAFFQTSVAGAPPGPTSRCEVVEPHSGRRAACKVVSAAPRGAGFWVTATTEPSWFDEAGSATVRFGPPASTPEQERAQ